MAHAEKCPIWIIFKNWFGFKLNCSERGKYARWLTRNITESTMETLRKVRSGDY